MARRRQTNQRILIGFAAVVAVLVLATVIGMVAGGGEDVPEYTSSRERDVITAVVDFDDSGDLRKVFDDVVSSNENLADGGYFVEIHCSTNGSDSVDNRLARGRFAIGQLGKLQVGLDPGTSEFEVWDGIQCPK